MTPTRIRVFLTMLVAVVLSAGLIACGGDESEDGRSATEILQASSKKEIKSGNIDLRMEARLDGVPQLNGPISIRMRGPFESHGDTQFPEVDWKVDASGAGQSVSAGLILLPDNAFVNFRGTNYELGEETVKEALKESKANQKQQTELKELGVNPANWLADGKVEEGEEIGGTATEKVTGRLDVARMLQDFNKILDSPRFRSQLPPGASASKITDAQIEEVKKAVKDPTFTVNIAKDDDTMRQLAAKANFTIPEKEQQQLDGFKGGSVSFRTTFTDVGKNVEVKAPSGARPISELLQGLGISPEALRGAGALGQSGG